MRIISLKIGQLIQDTVTGEIGLLIRRYNVIPECDPAVWVWEVLWTGAQSSDQRRVDIYTEEGIKNMILSEVFQEIKSI